MTNSKGFYLVALVTGMVLGVGAAQGFHAEPAAAQERFSPAPTSHVYAVPDASTALAHVSFDNNPLAIRDLSLNPEN